MQNGWEIRQGDSTVIRLITVTDEEDYTDYTGYLVVVDSRDPSVVLYETTILPDDDSGFQVQIPAEETKEFGTGYFKVAFEVTGEKDGMIFYRREIQWGLVITESLVNI